MGDPAALPRGQPAPDRAGGGARTQVTPAGRAGRRRVDPCLLRRPGAGRGRQRRELRTLVPRGEQTPAPAVVPEPRGADAPRGRRHHHRGLPEGAAAGRYRLHGQLPARAGRPEGRGDCHRADLCAEPGQRRALRVVGARHAEGQGAGAGQEPAPAATLAPGAAPRLRSAFRRPGARADGLRPGQPGRHAAEGRARRHADRCQARRLQTRDGAAAPVHELPGGRRCRSAARHRAQPRGLEGAVGRRGAFGLPGLGETENRRRCSGRPSHPSQLAVDPGGCAGPPPPPRHRPPRPLRHRCATPTGRSASCPS